METPTQNPKTTGGTRAMDKAKTFSPPKKPPGGKALARLRLFSEQRGIPVESNPAAGAIKRIPVKTRAAQTRAPRGAKPPTAKQIGNAYLAGFAARHPQQPKGTRAMAAPVTTGWRPLGPFSIPHGQTYGSGPESRPSVAGRIAAIAVDPGNPQHILIGAAGGGVWETRDLGATWAPRTDNQPSLATGAIAFDPQNPAIVYAGTGEGDFYSNLGVGLLRSTDGGTTWAVRATAPFVGTGFHKIIVDPQDGNRLYAATTGGLFRSLDGGATWSARRNFTTWDVSLRTPTTGSTPQSGGLFAAGGDGLFRSTNGGTGWTSVSLPGSSSGFARLACRQAPSNAGIVYAFGALSSGEGKLWRRGSFSGSFVSVNLPADLAVKQAWYDWFLAVAPNNPDVVYLGAINVHRGVRGANGSFTWTNISARSTGPSIHPDQHTITFSPDDPNVLYVGNDGGIYRSPDAGVNWTPLNRGLCITEFEYLAQHPEHEAWLLGGTQDNGTLRFEGEEVWFHVQDGDGGDVGINSGTPYTCFHTFFNMGMERSTTGGGWGSWNAIGPGVADGYASLFYPPVEVRDSNVAQAGETVFVSSNNGNTFFEATLPGRSGIASALGSRSATRIFVGTTAGEIYRVDRISGAWINGVRVSQPLNGFISDLIVDPTNESRLWLTCSQFGQPHVMRSDNSGATWTNVTGTLPDIPFNAIELDPANTQIVYAAADVGVFRSADGGATWSPFSNLLPNAMVSDLAFHGPSRLLRCATKSRGAWEIPVDLSTVPDVEIYLRDSAVDTGRLSPSPSGTADPFKQGANLYWWQSADIKIDSPTFQRPALDDIHFEIFEDDHGLLPAGLIHENPQRGKTVRVYIQVHNRGRKAATNVAVKAFFTDASLGLPDLPAAFWTNFPGNTLPSNSPWKVVAPHVVLPSLGAGEAKIAAFEWAVPTTAADHTCLLAIISADNDSITTIERSIAPLVTGEKKCGLKNLTVVGPAPSVGPRQFVVKVNLWSNAAGREFGLAADAGGRSLVRGFLTSKKLADLAQAAGLKKVTLSEDERAQLDQLCEEDEWIRTTLDTKRAFVPPKTGPWIAAFELPKKTPELLVLLLDPKSKASAGSILQTSKDGKQILGGYTFTAQTA